MNRFIELAGQIDGVRGGSERALRRHVIDLPEAVLDSHVRAAAQAAARPQRRGSGFEVRDSGFGVRVSDLGFRVLDFGFRVSGFGFWVSSFRFS
jgi:hypothetical protein